jgi:hypothetical protein
MQTHDVEQRFAQAFHPPTRDDGPRVKRSAMVPRPSNTVQQQQRYVVDQALDASVVATEIDRLRALGIHRLPSPGARAALIVQHRRFISQRVNRALHAFVVTK